jgi:hypothetical protein
MLMPEVKNNDKLKQLFENLRELDNKDEFERLNKI